jgi:uncharacterized protein (DUF2164 family)
MNEKTKKILLGAAMIIIPFSSVLVGGYFIYQGLKNKKDQKDNQNETK